jgi:hypothetical protein
MAVFRLSLSLYGRFPSRYVPSIGFGSPKQPKQTTVWPGGWLEITLGKLINVENTSTIQVILPICAMMLWSISEEPRVQQKV